MFDDEAFCQVTGSVPKYTLFLIYIAIQSSCMIMTIRCTKQFNTFSCNMSTSFMFHPQTLHQWDVWEIAAHVLANSCPVTVVIFRYLAWQIGLKSLFQCHVALLYDLHGLINLEKWKVSKSVLVFLFDLHCDGVSQIFIWILVCRAALRCRTRR